MPDDNKILKWLKFYSDSVQEISFNSFTPGK